MGTKIAFTGAYVPPYIVKNTDLEKIVDTTDEWIQSRSGIMQRHFAQGENTSELATKAALDMMRKGNIDPLDIDLIIVATASGDFDFPSTACLVQGNIGAKNALAFDVSAACSGFIFALSIADKYIKTGVYRNALVIGAEVLSKILDYDDRTTCVLFGDGAAGVFLTKSETGGILAEEMGSDGTGGMSLFGGECLSGHAFTPMQGQERRKLQMDGKAIFDFATRQTPKCIKSLLTKANMDAEKLKYVIPHQANRRIVQVFARKLGIPMDKFYVNIEEYGNTSSASIPIALNEMMEKGLLTQGDYILIAGFGGGLTWGAMLLEM